MNAQQQSKQNGRLRVLIADDVVETRRSMRLMMTQVPDTVVVAIAHDGRQAITLTDKEKPDIAFVDVNMPELDGLQAIEQMLAHHPNMACFVVSAERDKATRQRAIDAGARGFLLKPITIDQLTQTVNDVRAELMERRRRATTSQGQRYQRLEQQANEYIKARRVDDQAVAVLEELARSPACNRRYLRALAVLYVFRSEWRKLKFLAALLEKRQQ
ncbi:MAG TPA: response regulator [Anaerolineae bacterium]|nr:response regulator [Anaerolineae bacterium]